MREPALRKSSVGELTSCHDRRMWNVTEVHERLQALTEADPGHRRFGAARHRYLLDPPVTESRIARFEQEHGISLPPSYRAFITAVGSGGGGPCHGLFRFGSEVWARQQTDLGERWADLPATPFPHTDRFQPWPEETARPRHAPEDEYYDPCWFTGSLVIAEIGCASYFRLVVTGEARGQVRSDHLLSDQGLNPGPDFHDWYMQWLMNPGGTVGS